MEGSSIGASLAQGISGTEQQRDKRKKVAVIPANDMKEYRGMEMRLHSFLIPDTRRGDRKKYQKRRARTLPYVAGSCFGYV
jgi:ribosomal protein S9